MPDGSARASNKRWLEVREPGIPGRGLKMMRSSLAVAVVLAGLSVSGLAQQNNKSKVKPTHEKAAKQSAPLGKTAGPATASAANAKSLQTAEHQSGRVPASSRSGGKKTASALKPVKDKPNPPINFSGTGGGKGGGGASGANPYKGRLKQKGSGGGHH